MYKLFGIPSCDTVKKARALLEKKKIDFEFIDFKRVRLEPQDIERWKEAFGDFPLNKKGTTYKKLKDEYEALTPKNKIKFILDNSSLIKRPILEKNGKVLSFGFDEEKYSEIK